MRAPKTGTGIRQEQIAAAALELMSRHGPKALNIARLATQVGVVPSAIYRHYPSKDAVLDAVLSLLEQRLKNNLQAAREEGHCSLDRLESVLDRHLELIRENAAIPRVVFSEEVFSGKAKRRNRLNGIVQGYLDGVAVLIREGQAEGSIRAAVSPETASVMFIGLIQPAVFLWLTSGGGFDVEAHVRKAWGLFRQLLEAEPQSGESPGRFICEKEKKGGSIQ
jgi:AcrR family transcriptional regulator